MYGAFNLFNYQLKEIHRLQGRTNFTPNVTFTAGVNMIHYLRRNCLKTRYLEQS